ncbi:unnamed protein product [Rhizophagus irregularis]|nr:unnamed protein product [Rhizophagus irregularis]
MPRSKRKTQHCRNIAKKKRKIVNILNSDDDESTDEEIERVDNQIENEAEQFFSVLMKNMETLKFSKRPLKNGQTLIQLLSKEKSQETSDSEETQNNDEEINKKNANKSMKYVTFINQIETKLKTENQQLTSGHKMRLKAVQYYFQLLSKGHAN